MRSFRTEVVTGGKFARDVRGILRIWVGVQPASEGGNILYVEACFCPLRYSSVQYSIMRLDSLMCCSG